MIEGFVRESLRSEKGRRIGLAMRYTPCAPSNLSQTQFFPGIRVDSHRNVRLRLAKRTLNMAATLSAPVATPVSAPSPDHILQTGLAFWASKTLLSAVEMEVFTELARGPEEQQALAGRLGLHPRSAHDFLDALVALGFLEREDGRYRNTPSTDAFLDKRKPSYIGGILEMANQRLFGHWNRLTLALRTGERQSEHPGESDIFAALYADPARLKTFLRAMSGVSRGANVGIASKFPWANYRTVVDCGTAQGDLVAQV